MSLDQMILIFLFNEFIPTFQKTKFQGSLDEWKTIQLSLLTSYTYNCVSNCMLWGERVRILSDFRPWHPTISVSVYVSVP